MASAIFVTLYPGLRDWLEPSLCFQHFGGSSYLTVTVVALSTVALLRLRAPFRLNLENRLH